jgi:hypothetical protein
MLEHAVTLRRRERLLGETRQQIRIRMRVCPRFVSRQSSLQ